MSEREGGVVRVVSYNIRALKDDRRALVRVLRALRPDVLCLQEVPRHPFSGHRISTFAAEVGMTWSGGERGRMSTTVLSGMRLDVLAAGHHLFPVPRPQEPRGWGYMRVRLPGYRPFVAVSLHLSLKESQRTGHVAELRAAQMLADRGALVVAGDINETPQGRAWAALADGLDDVSGDLLSFPASAPVKRIDAILSSPQLHGRAVPVTEVDGVDAADLVRATDHLPLAVDLTLTPA